ncbi:hypothetical protein [Celeribacter sp.]|uniref:hypothetical protein n=1 Tax=Celeribacter sp. TaxID=1890673 RepID=UPI003A8EAD62
MVGSSLSSLLFVVPMLGIFSILFVVSRDLVQKQLALFIASYFIFAVLSEYLFGMPFSRKSVIGNFTVDLVSPTLMLFWISFYFASNIKIGRGAKDSLPLRRPDGQGTTINTVILALPLILFFAYFTIRNGVRVTGSFLEYRGQRSTLTDYMFVYYVVLVSQFRNSGLLLAVGLFAGASHMLSGERLRSFVYLIVILINYFRLDKRRHMSSAILILGFFFATLIGLLRSGNLGMQREYNVTHFGSVTVSSLYLLDFGSTLETFQKIQFVLGTFVANIIPSSFVPEAFNIRKAILTFADIPGGGWLPVFLKIQSGIIGVAVGGYIIGRIYRLILARTQRVSVMQPAYYAATLAFIATAPRWFMYTPFQLLKMPLYAFTLSAAMIFLAHHWPRKHGRSARV